MRKQSSVELVRIIRCGIGSETYCLEMSSVDSVAEASLIQSFDQASDNGQIGIITTENGDVPVYRLSERLSREVIETADREHVVILKSSFGRWAVQVGSVSRVTQVRVDQIVRVPEVVMDPTRNVFKGVVLFSGASQADTATETSRFLIDRDSDKPTTQAAEETASISLLLSPERLHPEAKPLLIESDRSAGGSPASASNEAQEEGSRRAACTTKPRKGQLVMLSITNDLIDKQRCAVGLSMAQILEVVSQLPMIPVPTAPGFVVGLACWRNQPVPLLNLAHRVGLPSTLDKQRIVIARSTDAHDLIAFPVDSAIRSLKLPLEAKPCLVPLGIRPDFVRGAYQVNEETLVVPDLHRVLASA